MPVPFREIARGQSVEHPRAVVQLEIFARLRPFAAERFYIEEIGREQPWPGGGDDLPPPPLPAENEHFAARMAANGAFDFTDKATGRSWPGLGLFSGQGDIGDSYDFSDIPAEREEVFDRVPCRIGRREWPGGVVELIAAGELEIPARTDSAARSRSAARVKLPFTQRVLAVPGHRELEVRIEFTNTAADHRLRWNLPLAGEVGSTLAGLKFSAVRRAAGTRPAGAAAPRIFPEHPADHFVAAGGLACFGLFPVNIEAVGEAPGRRRLAITVCRSTSYLTNPIQGTTRPGTGAGPHTPVPECRCLGRTFSLSFALRAYRREDEGR